MTTGKVPLRSRKARGMVAVAGVGAVLGMYLQLASGSVELAERVLTLVVKAKQVFVEEPSTAVPDTCEHARK